MARVRMKTSHSTPLIPTAHIRSPYRRALLPRLRRSIPDWTRLRMPLADLCHHCNHFELLNALTLSLIDPKMTQALAAPASDDLMIELCAPEVPWTADHTDHLLAIWPWIPPVLKPWLRNYVTPLLYDEDLIPFVAIDPEWPFPSISKNCIQRAVVKLWKAIRHHQPPSVDELVNMLNDERNSQIFSHTTVTMVRYADPDTLRTISQHTDRLISRLILLSPQAPPDRVKHIVSTLRLPYKDVGIRDREREEYANPLRTILAPINLAHVRLSPDPRKALLAIGAWSQYPLTNSPQMTLTATSRHERLLANAARGAYADVVTIIADRLSSTPTSFTPCPFPTTVATAHAMSQNPNASTAERAVAFRAGVTRFGRAPRTCLAKPSTTSPLDPSWADRLSHHTSHDVRIHVAAHVPLPTEVMTHLLRGDDIETALVALGHPNTTDEQANAFLRRVHLQYLLLVLPETDLTLVAIERLATHPSVNVHATLALSHPITPELRTRLLHHRRATVRAAMAQRTDLTLDEITILTRQPLNMEIAQGLVCHPLTPSDTITQIAKRWGRVFCRAILKHPHATDVARVTAAMA